MSRALPAAGASAAYLAAALAVGLVHAGPAAAADWHVNPRLELAGVYDDNYSLLPGASAISVSGGQLGAQLAISAHTPRSEFSLTPQARSSYFPSQHQFNSTDGQLDAVLKHAWQKTTMTLNAGYLDQSVFANERPQAVVPGGDQGGAGNGDSGRIVADNRQRLYRVAAQLAQRLGQRSNLEAAAGYVSADYQRQILGAQLNYRNTDGYLGWAYDATQTDTLRIGAVAEDYRTDSSSLSSSHTNGLRAEWARRVSQTLRSYLRVGGARTSYDQPATGARPPSASNATYAAGLRGSYQVTEIYLDASRSIEPNGSGFLVRRDQVQLNATRQLRPLLYGSIGVLGIADAATGGVGAAAFADRHYAVGHLQFERRLTRAWSLTGRYEYVWQSFSGEDSNRRGNRLDISIVYEAGRP
jgi:hypothetical protein